MNKIRPLLKPQKKLIVIFLLTIVLPCLALSIFGILAIKNEKYRLEQKTLDEQQNEMLLLKTQFSNHLKNIEDFIEKTAQLAAIGNKNYKLIRQNSNIVLAENQPIDQVFILFRDGQSFFPLLQSAPDVSEYLNPSLTSTQQNIFAKAQKSEYTQNDFGTAIALYTELYNRISDYNLKAQMLNNLARVQKKSGKISSAAGTYTRIIKHYPSSFTSFHLPLLVTAEFQLINCDRMSGNNKQALVRGLNLYDKILNGEMYLAENQFHTYSEMLTEILNILIDDKDIISSNNNERKYYDSLKEKYKIRTKHWKDKKLIETEIFPALSELKNQLKTKPFHLSKRIQGEDFLITVIPFSDILCIKWNNERMISEWLQPIVSNLLLNDQYNVVISDLLGKILLGEENQNKDPVSITSEFDDYYPPWKIQFSSVGTNTEFEINFFKSYYFWSILTLLIILIFGTSLIIRMMSREQEIMSIKSNFIASVSHELKTPLTSIKALTERLVAGKVKDSEKMHEYFTVIEHDANKLTRLVKNILDFSKIEADKKEYSFELLDLKMWLDKTIDDFCRDHIHDQIEIKKQIGGNVINVSIDKDALAQCINNLLDNAVKFSADSKYISVQLKKESEYAIISVKDQGIGIPKANIPQIFDKFFQGEPSSRHSVKGTGLGLALVKHAIEAHGGKIEVQSCPGKGSNFTLFIPIVNQNH